MFRVVCLPMSYRRRKTVIHQYINNGYYIVLDVNSGSVHSVDPLLYDVISFLSERIPDSEKPFQIAQSLKDETAAALKEKYSQEEIREAFEDIQELIDQEELFTADIYKNFVMDFYKRKTVFKALCLHIAHDCNLACQYCFAEEGEYHGRRALMTLSDLSILAELDFIFAKAALSRHYNCVEPKFNNKRYINIKDGRHPLLNPKQVVPINIRVGDSFDLLIVTGPNTGGKTVSLKTVGLFTLMGQSGLHIPAFEGSELAVFDNVFADIVKALGE